MIVSHAHRFIFLKTRKTAGTSLEIALSAHCGPDDVITPVTEEDELLRAAAGGRPPQNYDSPPLRRKAFNHMPASMVRRVVGAETWDDYFRFTVERNPWDAVVSLYHWVSRSQAEPVPFAEFVASPAVEGFAQKNFAIYRLDGRIAVDRVCRYETLAADLAEVWDHLALPGGPDLPRAKGNVRPPESRYASYYDDAGRARVAELFAPVIEDLHYRF